MKQLVFLFILMLTIQPFNGHTQISQQDSIEFRAYEDSINILSDTLLASRSEHMRKVASNKIILALKKALIKVNSFLYPFNNLQSISIVQPEDETFRIFTWQLGFDNNTFRYFGAIQMNSPELKLYPLVDYSVVMDNISRVVTDNERWIGALYYDIVKQKAGKKYYYTLFGYDGNNAFSTKKVADVMWFTEEGEIRFGAPIFDLGEDIPYFRYVMEFKKGASAGIRFSPENKKIIFDHLIPVDDKSEGMYFNYVPDGSYDGFQWKKGQWRFVDKLFDYKLKDGDFPMGH